MDEARGFLVAAQVEQVISPGHTNIKQLPFIRLQQFVIVFTHAISERDYSFQEIPWINRRVFRLEFPYL